MPELLYVLGAVIAFIALTVILILSLRGTLTVGYNGELFLRFKVLFFNLKLLPVKEKKKSYRRSMSRSKAKKIRRLVAKKEERKRAFKEKLFGKKKEEKVSEEKPADKEVKETDKPEIPVRLIAREAIDLLSAFTEIIAIVTRRFTKHLRIKVSRLKVRIATPDPSVTAVTYGACTGIINVLLPILRDVDNLGLPREECFDISADFVSDTPDIDMKVSFSLRVWHIADILLHSLFGGLSKYVKRKGGIDRAFDNISEIIKAFSSKHENKN